MNKQELLEKLKTFDDDSEVVFITDSEFLLQLDEEGADINGVAEVNNGRQKIIALME
ncbi:hypothetical protein LCGC14_1108760 [marine sediment metagenome]|uniref:Uncharacterized protein n=1 Tax=marine sediment metagenome TaxID=412755 RepID=A0A0F9MC58_9ZZZZ